jgi:hypothetical protein
MVFGRRLHCYQNKWVIFSFLHTPNVPHPKAFILEYVRLLSQVEETYFQNPKRQAMSDTPLPWEDVPYQLTRVYMPYQIPRVLNKQLR